MYGIAHARECPDSACRRQIPPLPPHNIPQHGDKIGLQRQAGKFANVLSSCLQQTLPQAGNCGSIRTTRLNIIWLVSESLRADMLTQQYMPNTWAFAKRGAHFTEHFSGGNGTRMGIFSCSMGCTVPIGNLFWNSVEDLCSLMGFLLNAGYAMRMQTSSHFTYPEFDKTVWANVPGTSLHEDDQGAYWERDRRNVDRAIDWIAEQENGGQPYFFFQFFESPHANYSFPAESIVQEPYLETFNYATLDVDRDMHLVKARYINSVNHLDQQLGKLLKKLDESGALENTLVIITGDHGEEFMENGHWGHNSAYTNAQTQVPLVIFAPQVKPQVVSSLTSHLDIAPTVLNLLGTTTPADTYSLGHNLFGDKSRNDTLVSGWNTSALFTHDYKLSLSMQAFILARRW